MWPPRASGPLALCRPGDPAPAGRGGYVLAVPGDQAPIYAVDLPPGVTGVARLRVARQHLADRLGGTGARLDLVAIPGSATVRGAFSRVICADPGARTAWCNDPLAQGTRCRAVLPDYLTLPGAQDQVTLEIAADGTVRARLGAWDGFTAPAALAPALLRAALAAQPCTRAVTHGAAPAPELAEVLAAAGVQTETVPAMRTEAVSLDAATLALDLRHADRAATGQVAGLGLWTAAAVAGLAGFALWAGSVLLETRAQERDTTALRRATTEVLREGLLPSGPILDIRQQVIQRLADTGGPGSGTEAWPLDHLSALSVTLFGKGARVQTIDFAPARGHAAVVHARDFATAEGLLDDLRAAGFDPADTSVRALAGGNVELRFRLPPGPVGAGEAGQ